MTEQERALWVAVYVAAMGREVDCHEVATQAVREMRASEAALAAEEVASRGEPPFAMGDVVTCKGMGNPTTADVRACWWDAERREWVVDLDYGGRLIDRISAGGDMRKVTP